MTSMEQGIALLGAGRFHEAVQSFGAALRREPLSAQARIGLSQACQGIGDPWAAAAWLSDACRVAPQRPELWLELGRLLAQQQREAELEPLLQAALALHPQDAALLAARAELHLRNKRYAQALPDYTRLRELQPRERATVLHHGYCLEQTGDIEAAARAYREALALDEAFLEAHVDLSGVLWRLEDFNGAFAHAQRAVELAPNHPYAVRILGTALLNLNRLDEAKVQLRRALELQPGLALAELDLAFALLLAGELEEGWAMYARRWRDTDRLRRPAFFSPDMEWKGPREEPLQGKAIAVYAEQGLGDVIQFIRYAPHLQREGATVHALIHPELAALVGHSIEGVHCPTGPSQVHVEHHVALLDLPMHYGTTLATIPAQVPYLRAPADKAQAWRERLAPWQGAFKVGLAWSGSPQQVNNNNRAMRLSDLLPLIGMEGVQCFSLQKGDALRFTDATPAAGRLVDFTAQWGDFTDSAAMIGNLDLVITVDTAIAHLAGALGKPVWTMLPPNADWRWLLERDDSPWYPTMRLFRRGHGEARAQLVDRVVRALRTESAGRGRASAGERT